MPRISQFVGLVFDQARSGPLSTVTTPPYDTIDPEGRAVFLDASRYSVIRLDLSEDEPGPDKYRSAAETLRGWLEEGALVPTARPAYFPYEMRFTLDGRSRRIRGMICQVELEPWGGSIIPHERTMAGPIEDRLHLLRAARANLSCVYGIYPGPRPEVAKLLDEVAEDPPPYAVVDEEGVEHRMWILEDAPQLAACLEREPLLIADGHHRYTTALRFREESNSERGPGPWDHVMMLVVDAAKEAPPVLPYHRIVSYGPVPRDGTPVSDLKELLAGLSDDDLVYGIAVRQEGVLTHRLATLGGPPPAVRALHDEVLDGTVDEAALSFTQDAARAEAAVRAGKAEAALLLPPTTTERIREVVERGERLPQKSTFFWPKPRTGMVIRPLD